MQLLVHCNHMLVLVCMQHLNAQVRSLVMSAEQSNDLKRQIRTLTLFAQLGPV